MFVLLETEDMNTMNVLPLKKACLMNKEHGRSIKTEEKAKVVAAGWGMYLNAALTI